MTNAKTYTSSFQELIDGLEHIEVDQLHSDIPANVRAELKRLKRNLSAILSFLENCEHSTATDPKLSIAIGAVRQECMSLHLTISKILLAQFFHLNVILDLQYPAQAAVQYRRICEQVCEMCQLSSPRLAEQLGSSF